VLARARERRGAGEGVFHGGMEQLRALGGPASRVEGQGKNKKNLAVARISLRLLRLLPHLAILK
jgi:hypothetical protein